MAFVSIHPNTLQTKFLSNSSPSEGSLRPGADPDQSLKGGNLERGRLSLYVIANIICYCYMLLNNASVYMFLRIQNESLIKECIWVRIRGAFLAKKGGPKLNFHREGGGGSCPHLPP